MALRKVDLSGALEQLDIAADSAAVAKPLAPGASPAALARLVKTPGPIPAEVTDWFRWHDGQTGCYDRANGALIRYHHEDSLRP